MAKGDTMATANSIGAILARMELNEDNDHDDAQAPPFVLRPPRGPMRGSRTGLPPTQKRLDQILRRKGF